MREQKARNISKSDSYQIIARIIFYDRNQTIHWVAMATFWRTFHHDGKMSPAWGGESVCPPTLSLYLPSQAKLGCKLQLRRQIQSPCFSSTPICTLWFEVVERLLLYEANPMSCVFQNSDHPPPSPPGESVPPAFVAGGGLYLYRILFVGSLTWVSRQIFLTDTEIAGVLSYVPTSRVSIRIRIQLNIWMRIRI